MNGEEFIRNILIGQVVNEIYPLIGVVERIDIGKDKPIGIRVIGIKFQKEMFLTFFN